MALFGKKKNKVAESEETKAAIEEEIEEEKADEGEQNEEQAAPELSTEEQFKKDCEELTQRLRFMFPQQMLIGFYYGELQAEGYIDDFCCYATDGKLIEKADIPSKCGMNLADMVSREDKLEQAFFKFRKSAAAHSGKPCNAVSMMMLNDGQVKIDVTAADLIEGEEDKRYARWRKKVEMGNPRYMPPKIEQKKMQHIQEKTQDLYKELGTEFFSFLPDTEFKIAYFYAENGENGVFYFHRMVLNDGEIIDGDEMFDRFEMDKEQAAKDRIEIVKYFMQIRDEFVKAGEKPFSSMTLQVSDKGEFRSHLGFGPTDAAGEKQRLENWKETFK